MWPIKNKLRRFDGIADQIDLLSVQCANLRIFLPLWFYVKQNFKKSKPNQNCQNYTFWQYI